MVTPDGRGRTGPNTVRLRRKRKAYFFFLGFFVSFFGLLSLATKILPYVEIIL